MIYDIFLRKKKEKKEKKKRYTLYNLHFLYNLRIINVTDLRIIIAAEKNISNTLVLHGKKKKGKNLEC